MPTPANAPNRAGVGIAVAAVHLTLETFVGRLSPRGVTLR